jgi:hypothetical protein
MDRLGEASVLVYVKGKALYSPNLRMVAIISKTGKVTISCEGPPHAWTDVCIVDDIRPLRDGVISIQIRKSS